MRRIAILALLFLLMQFILPLQLDANAGTRQTLLVFGFLMLAAYTVGELSTLVSLPRITGYLFAGMLFRPSVNGEPRSTIARSVPRPPSTMSNCRSLA